MSACAPWRAGVRSMRRLRFAPSVLLHSRFARGERLIGIARVMVDGVLYFFLADMIVDPEFRGERLGDRLMKMITDYFDRSARPGASITLLPLKGEAFYERFGF